MNAALEKADAPSPPPANEVVRILVAEDVAVNRELIQMMLKPVGHHIELVEDGAQAVRAAAAAQYDVILMDVQMPNMDGLQATRAIRAMGGAYAEMPIVALSANVTPDQIKLCMDAGMSCHLAKPFSSENLRAAVSRWAPKKTPQLSPVLLALIKQASWPAVSRLLLLLREQLEAFEMMAAADREVLQRTAHGLRGSGAALGFRDLMSACRDLEDDCRMARSPEASLYAAKRIGAEVREKIVDILNNGAPRAPGDNRSRPIAEQMSCFLDD